ncbi:cyclophilin-like protein [Meira miltonrushii]|uniref:Cyclophilin-like protein n=1 Tax=Meira miltonrushii TaxID=1280837 RepID=A0A316VLJ1_9BASI|nr:cyclophilin-like protein [Meira miltonrushii]PWN37938.1 cyclophilin-like protein [Meira miltonrushii]
MSSIYITEPPISGKVILETSRGEIEVELFADQCPLACKNFIALALEGYYDNQIWHRFVSDFIIQSGDPTGTGVAGESFYGQDFADEFHQRLRFNRRGLLGMANGGERNTNGSQFFLTLGNTPELQGKHTMFGRIHNNTIYNLIALADSVGEVGEDDKPLYPPKLKTVRVMENPFEGQIQLRITREEKQAAKKNKKEAEARKLERSSQGTKKKKNTALLSFGADEDGEDGEEMVFKGPKSSHDLLKDDKRLRRGDDSKGKGKRSSAEDDTIPASMTKRRDLVSPDRDHESERANEAISLSNLREDHASKRQKNNAEDQIASLEASIRGDYVKKEVDEGAERSEKKAKGKGKSLLDEYKAKYKKGKSSGSSKKDEETIERLRKFQNRMRSEQNGKFKAGIPKPEPEEEIPEDMREYGGEDGEDDKQGWRDHRFDFGGKAVLEDQHEGEEYITLDPRDSSSFSALKLGFGGQDGHQRAREEQARSGRRGRDWVDERGGDKRHNLNGQHKSYDRGNHSRHDDQPRPRNLDKW